MKEDIIEGENALRGRGAVCPSIIISYMVSGKMLHQTRLNAFSFPPRSAVLLPLCAYICCLCPVRVMSSSDLLVD